MKALALVTALAGLAALPSAASARPPEPPPAGCIVVSTNVVCVDDLPQVIGDPGGSINRIVCYGDVRICE